jgi:hypothetical protein
MLIDIGEDHKIEYKSFEDDPQTGINVHHKTPEGKDCVGWVPFKGGAWDKAFEGEIVSWDIQSKDPLTLSPSILCKRCGDHGFIRNNKWVKA